MNEIAKLIGGSRDTIRRWLVKYNIKRRSHSKCAKGKLNGRFKPLKQRFWGKINIGSLNECWEWQAATDVYNYGIIQVNNKVQKAHRIAWELSFGNIPSSMSICHKCDNPKCCNPNHLFLGTQKDNMDDMYKKGRRGKLTKKQILDIRSKYKSGQHTQYKLAKSYGVSPSLIGQIVRNKIWKSINNV